MSGGSQGSNPSSGHAAPSAPRLAVSHLEDAVSFFLGQALDPATMRSYRSGQTRFVRFCHEAGLQSLPVSEQVLCWFVEKLGSESLSYQTIKCYLSAVRHYSIMAGHGDPFSPEAFPVLQYVLRGVRCAQRPPTQPHLPITSQILHHIKNQWASHCWGDGLRDAMGSLLCGVFWFMRAEEFTSRPGEHSPSFTVEGVVVDD